MIRRVLCNECDAEKIVEDKARRGFYILSLRPGPKNNEICLVFASAGSYKNLTDIETNIEILNWILDHRDDN